LKELDNIQKRGLSLTQGSDNATELQTNCNKILIGLKEIRVIGRRANIKDRIAGFKMLRGKKDVDIMNAFVHYILSHLIPHNVWLASRSEERTGKLFTIQDEAFAVLLTMNNWNVWEKLATGEKRGRGQHGDTLFTNQKKSINGETIMLKGWSNDGMKEFNKILCYLIQVRNSDDTIEMERERL